MPFIFPYLMKVITVAKAVVTILHIWTFTNLTINFLVSLLRELKRPFSKALVMKLQPISDERALCFNAAG